MLTWCWWLITSSILRNVSAVKLRRRCTMRQMRSVSDIYNIFIIRTNIVYFVDGIWCHMFSLDANLHCEIHQSCATVPVLKAASIFNALLQLVFSTHFCCFTPIIVVLWLYFVLQETCSIRHHRTFGISCGGEWCASRLRASIALFGLTASRLLLSFSLGTDGMLMQGHLHMGWTASEMHFR